MAHWYRTPRRAETPKKSQSSVARGCSMHTIDRALSAPVRPRAHQSSSEDVDTLQFGPNQGLALESALRTIPLPETVSRPQTRCLNFLSPPWDGRRENSLQPGNQMLFVPPVQFPILCCPHR